MPASLVSVSCNKKLESGKHNFSPHILVFSEAFQTDKWFDTVQPGSRECLEICSQSYDGGIEVRLDASQRCLAEMNILRGDGCMLLFHKLHFVLHSSKSPCPAPFSHFEQVPTQGTDLSCTSERDRCKNLTCSCQQFVLVVCLAINLLLPSLKDVGSGHLVIVKPSLGGCLP